MLCGEGCCRLISVHFHTEVGLESLGGRLTAARRLIGWRGRSHVIKSFGFDSRATPERATALVFWTQQDVCLNLFYWRLLCCFCFNTFQDSSVTAVKGFFGRQIWGVKRKLASEATEFWWRAFWSLNSACCCSDLNNSLEVIYRWDCFSSDVTNWPGVTTVTATRNLPR